MRAGEDTCHHQRPQHPVFAVARNYARLQEDAVRTSPITIEDSQQTRPERDREPADAQGVAVVNSEALRDS